MCGGRGQVQQCDQDNGRGLGLVEYAMWNSDTKSAAWSLRAYWQSILESTIQEISYLGSLSIMTGVEAGCILSEKVLDVAVVATTYHKDKWSHKW